MAEKSLIGLERLATADPGSALAAAWAKYSPLRRAVLCASSDPPFDDQRHRPRDERRGVGGVGRTRV